MIIDIIIFTRPDRTADKQPVTVQEAAVVSVLDETVVVVIDEELTKEILDEKIRNNLDIRHGRIIDITTSAASLKEGEYPVTVLIVGDDYNRVEAQFSVLLTKDATADLSNCDRIWVVDVEAHTTQKYIVDVPYQPAVTEQRYVKDKDAVPPQGHYEDVMVEEKGHWEETVVKEAVEAQGHYETKVIEHPEVPPVTHEEQKVRYTTLYTYYDSEGHVINMITAEDLNNPDSPGFSYAYYSTENNYAIYYYETIVDEPGKAAYTEVVEEFIVDVPGEEAVVILTYVIDEPEHMERQFIVEVPGEEEQGHYETVVVKAAVAEQGHYETVQVDEVGHWEYIGC